MAKWTVGELIEELKKYDPNMAVRREDDETGSLEHFIVERTEAYCDSEEDNFHYRRIYRYKSERKELLIIY